jgi:hypothetical protein
MLGLAGVTVMEASLGTGPALPLTIHPHVVRNIAKSPTSNISKKDPIFFIGKP